MLGSGFTRLALTKNMSSGGDIKLSVSGSLDLLGYSPHQNLVRGFYFWGGVHIIITRHFPINYNC